MEKTPKELLEITFVGGYFVRWLKVYAPFWGMKNKIRRLKQRQMRKWTGMQITVCISRFSS